MKKLITVILVLALLLPAAACAELSEQEHEYIGSWSMYAENGKGKIYAFIITFLDNMTVVQRSMVFENGVLTSDNKASGDWGVFTDKTILLTLAGTDMTAMIKDNGYLYMYFLEGPKLCGVYSKCPDMTSALGW